MNMRRFSQRKKKLNFNKKDKPGILLVVVGFIFISAAFILLIFKSGIFNVKKIEINLVRNLDCVNEVQIKDTSQLLGQNIFFINSLDSVINIKGKFICVKGVTLSKIFPDKVRLEVFGREPKVKLYNLNNEATNSANLENIATPSAGLSIGDFYLIDDEVIFAKDNNQISAPNVYLKDDQLSLGKKIDDLVKKCLNILEKSKSLGLDIQISQIVNNSLVIFPSSSQPRIIFSLEKDDSLQIASLQLILKIAKIDNESLEFIDLRFDKPVVKFAPKKK